MSSFPVKVRVPKAAELVASHLRNQIISNSLREGDSLPHEAEMIAQYNVSRPTLREAFRILESEGLLSISRGTRGAQVHRPRIEILSRHLGVLLQSRGVHLADVYLARALVEPPAARLVAEHGDTTGISKLSAILEKERSAIEDDRQFSLESNAFRGMLVQLAGVQTLGLIIDMLNEMLQQDLVSLYRTSAEMRDRMKAKRKSINAQQRLLDLMSAGKAEEAETFWRQHLMAVGSSIMNLENSEESTRRDPGQITILE